jgi:hypothetical protein
LRVIYDADDSIDVGEGFRFGEVNLEGGRLIHTFVHDDAVAVFDGPWNYSNPVYRYDVNQNQGASAADALAVINELQYRRYSDRVTQRVKDPATVDLAYFRFHDVSRDDMITARDVLLVINELARIPREGDGVGAEQVAFPQVSVTAESRSDDRLPLLDSLDVASSVRPSARIEEPFWRDANTSHPRGPATDEEKDASDPSRLESETVDAVMRLTDFTF